MNSGSHATIPMAAEMMISMEQDIETPSSFFIMEMPGYQGPERNMLLFADCAVNQDPNPEQLADIAVASAHSANQGAAAFGPVLQGFNKPGSDLSRGATVEDILGAMVITENLSPL